MTKDVKPRRRYESTRRQEQAAQTRRDILAAAGILFRERGYAATSMPSIAAEAGVVVETIYRAFGSKAGLLVRSSNPRWPVVPPAPTSPSRSGHRSAP